MAYFELQTIFPHQNRRISANLKTSGFPVGPCTTETLDKVHGIVMKLCLWCERIQNAVSDSFPAIRNLLTVFDDCAALEKTDHLAALQFRTVLWISFGLKMSTSSLAKYLNQVYKV
jgi:hypothetical protein